MSKVLIIKIGFSETLDGGIDTSISLGDVLRTTVILSAFKRDHVTWLTGERAVPLLEGNKCIDRILAYDLTSALQLKGEKFDTVVNLEKVPGVCALSDSINAWRRFGFRFDQMTGNAQSYDGAERVLSLSFNLSEKRKNEHYWQQALMHMISREWKGEKYILGYRPKSKTRFDVGFNWEIGPKWPNKAWPKEHWDELEKLLKNDFSVSWQQGRTNINEYLEWINSCRLIVTNDSLGLHCAIALEKTIVALFGPTSSREVYLYGRGVKLLPNTNYNCVPCLRSACKQPRKCVDLISPQRVRAAVRKLLGK